MLNLQAFYLLEQFSKIVKFPNVQKKHSKWFLRPGPIRCSQNPITGILDRRHKRKKNHFFKLRVNIINEGNPTTTIANATAASYP